MPRLLLLLLPERRATSVLTGVLSVGNQRACYGAALGTRWTPAERRSC
jgi:hypothetical protein